MGSRGRGSRGLGGVRELGVRSGKERGRGREL